MAQGINFSEELLFDAEINSARQELIDLIDSSKSDVFNDEEENFEIEYEMTRDMALESIQELSPAYRTVFNLYFVEDYSHKEIAEKLGISEGTSKSNLAKAKIRLKQIVESKIGKEVD